MFMASDAQARFSRLGLSSNFYFDAHLQLVSAATMTKSDVVLAISHVGRMPFLLEAVEVAKEQGAMVVAITQPDTPLAEMADVVLPVVVPADPLDARRHRGLSGATGLSGNPDGGRRPCAAVRRLAASCKRVRQVLQERGSESEPHPVMPSA